jgi:3-deoxy-D-manno-octulosonic-acid transferase
VILLALYLLGASLAAPLVIAVVLVHPRLRVHAGERLGAVSAGLEPGAVWIHAASLGEGRAAEGLIAALRAQDPGVTILRTCTSDVARGQRIGADDTLCLPIDVPVVVGAWLDRVRPRCLVLVEAELWPALLVACRRRAIPVALVSPREARGVRRLRRIGPLWRAITRDIVRIEGDLKRAAPLGVPAVRWDGEAIVAGCTHEGEEEALLDAMERFPHRPLLVLAPRDPRRFERVADLLRARGVRWSRRSTVGDRVPPDVRVLLLDTLGELPGLYSLARVAYIGGTFNPSVGGHSPAEAAAAGCPIVHGPFTESNAAAFAALETWPALMPDELGESLEAAWAAARQVTAGGSAEGVAHALRPLLGAPVPPERWLRPWLAPLAAAWLVAVRLRPRPLKRAPIPVISVGGVTAGGSGKTPVSAWIARQLAEREPVIVARGYGRKRGADARLDGEAADLGDELAMLLRRGFRVASCPDRLAGIRAATKDGAGLAVLDDGLQYGDVARDLEVVVLDARWPGGGGPIPVGTARVPWSWLARADVVWVNHGPVCEEIRRSIRPDAVVVEARYRAKGWIRRGEQIPLDAIPPLPAVAFAGIARPEGFFSLLRRLGVLVDRTWTFPDHHAFTWNDLQSIEAWLDDHIVVTTEKDAARLPEDSAVYALRVGMEIVTGQSELEAVLARFR